MGVRAGYKQTDVGVIPKDWDTPVLGELFTFKNGLNKAKAFFGHGTPIVNYMDVYRTRGIVLHHLQGRVSLSREEIKAFEVRKGDVFFTRTSETAEEVGITSVMLDEPRDTVFSGFVLRARPKDDSLDDQFKKYCFSTSFVRKQIVSQSTETTRALTNGKCLSVVVIARPPKAEQAAIATALSDTDALINSLEKVIAKKRAIKQGAMQQLLAGKKRLPGFDGEWVKKKVRDFTDAVAGGTPSTLIDEYWGGEIRWMNSGELSLKEVFDVEGRITQSGLRNSATRLLPPNCVLIGLAGQGKTRGTVAINRVELCTNQSVAAILPNNSFLPEFLFYSLDSRYLELRMLSAGDGGRGGLNLTIIKNLLMPLPPTKAEQTAIAQVLSDMDAEMQQLEHKLMKFRMIKQGMMQELLTGKKRLI